jgi:hypothetical protein
MSVFAMFISMVGDNFLWRCRKSTANHPGEWAFMIRQTGGEATNQLVSRALSREFGAELPAWKTAMLQRWFHAKGPFKRDPGCKSAKGWSMGVACVL